MYLQCIYPIQRNIKVNHRFRYSTLWSDIKPAIDTDNTINKTYLLQRENKKVRKATDINMFCLTTNILIITRPLTVYQIYNHLTLILSDYKSDIAP